jgi:aminoglycoside phosphotransferase (APT) family kinase protein
MNDPAPISLTCLDIEKPAQLLDYLRRTDRIGSGETPQFQTLTGGVSNRTVLVHRAGGDSWVCKQALHKLRVKVNWFSDPSRIQREALGLRWLEKLAPPDTITPLVFEDPGHHLLAMQAVPQPHENWKSMLTSGRIDLPLVEQFGALLGEIHRRSAESVEPLREIFDDRSFFESLRLEPYYAYTAQQVPEARSFIDRLIQDTRARRLALVHGDYSPKNILVRNDRLILLDHEVIHWGDPAFDVGFALTHLLSKANHRRDLRFIEAAMRFRETYSAALGPVYFDSNLDLMCARHLLACLLARIAGRSPLEYLDEAQRQRQQQFAVDAMKRSGWPLQQIFELFAQKVIDAPD